MISPCFYGIITLVMLSAPLALQLESDQSFILAGPIKTEDIQAIYAQILRHHQSHLKLDGFRIGKVPLEIVKENFDPSVLLEETANKVISQIYELSLNHHHLSPIIPPQVKFLSKKLELDSDWSIEISSCLTPKINIKANLYPLIKKIDSKLEIKAKTDKILTLLEESSVVVMPKILIDYEVSRYQTSKSKDKAELAAKLTKEWTINLAISQIASTEKIIVNPEEIKAILTKNPNISQNPNLIHYLLLQQKVLDFLLAKIG